MKKGKSNLNRIARRLGAAALLIAMRLAALALSNGCGGVVASAHEARPLRDHLGLDFTIVTPGVRPAGSGRDDQARVVTPAQAVAAGSTYIVVGRPITDAPDPAAEARAILDQIATQTIAS